MPEQQQQTIGEKLVKPVNNKKPNPRATVPLSVADESAKIISTLSSSDMWFPMHLVIEFPSDYPMIPPNVGFSTKFNSTIFALLI